MLPNLVEGVVVDSNDPQQMGRLKIYVPSIDGENYNIDDLPWVTYVTTFAGQTRDYPSGPNSSATSGLVSYGMWTPPKIGAQVIVGFLYNNPNKRIYMGSYFRPHGNRSLPQGRTKSDISEYPLSDTLEPIQPQADNLSSQFSGKVSSPEAISRGGYERNVAQGKTDKDGTEGYQKSVISPEKLDSQTFCLTTPGHHSLIFQDNPENGRVRLKTSSGHQIILDDSNERIYISTARGNTWLEMDQDGRVHVYAGSGFHLSSGGDLNLTASGNVAISGKSVSVNAEGDLKMGACGSVNISGSGVNLDSSGGFNILSSSSLLLTGSNIHLNSPGNKAGSAVCPDSPSVVPTHEPWGRTDSLFGRNKNWKA